MNSYYDMNGVAMELMEWATAFEKQERQIGYEQRDGITVSTVWLGLDHSFGDGPPLIFETMIFGGERDDYQDRYSTREEAEEGHRRALALAFGEASNQESDPATSSERSVERRPPVHSGSAPESSPAMDRK